MNFRRLRPRVNYPLMKKGGAHVMSRKKPRSDAKQETKSLISEVLNEEEKPDGEPQK